MAPVGSSWLREVVGPGRTLLNPEEAVLAGSLWLPEEEAPVGYLLRREVEDLVGSPSFLEETHELLGVEDRVGNPEDPEGNLADRVGNLWVGSLEIQEDVAGSP